MVVWMSGQVHCPCFPMSGLQLEVEIELELMSVSASLFIYPFSVHKLEKFRAALTKQIRRSGRKNRTPSILIYSSIRSCLNSERA